MMSIHATREDIVWTHSMIGIVEAQAANQPNFFARERREQLLHGQNVLGDLRGGIKRRANNLVGFHWLSLMDCQANYTRDFQHMRVLVEDHANHPTWDPPVLRCGLVRSLPQRSGSTESIAASLEVNAVKLSMKRASLTVLIGDMVVVREQGARGRT